MSTSPPDIITPSTGEAPNPGEPRARRRTPVLDILLALTVLVVLAAGAFWGWHWWQQRGPTPQGVTAANGVAFGPHHALTVVDIYLDPLCPDCQNLESTDATRITNLIDHGTQVRYHVVNFLDNESNNNLSSRAANAAYCASDQGEFRHYLTTMMGEVRTTNPTSDAQLIAMGQKEGITATSFATCVHSGRYIPFVRRVAGDTTGRHIKSVPTVLVNGKPSQIPTTLPRCTTKSCR